MHLWYMDTCSALASRGDQLCELGLVFISSGGSCLSPFAG